MTTNSHFGVGSRELVATWKCSPDRGWHKITAVVQACVLRIHQEAELQDWVLLDKEVHPMKEMQSPESQDTCVWQTQSSACAEVIRALGSYDGNSGTKCCSH